ncbi:helix-turn-helix domain-containing protein [Kingella kingae]|uniref:helix-turn-helix domain-containing protein n=1 Tax=Kingella kingae TaxID=504 RepID=UPI0009B855D2|nr:helix-turn-helix domain-containing protein [Kingella kingae]MDK4526523.1 helix-turn-helix domain-containing protein [Kingella kingae]MDK4532490.1 helix-turn-helix domain-containing protein [Kingella kingae]
MKTYTVSEAAKIVHCHPETLREYIRLGRLVAAKIGRAYCIRQTKLDEFIQSLENDAMQASLKSNGSETSCRNLKNQASTKENRTAFGILTSTQAVSELDALLAQPIRQKPKPTAYN